MNACTNFIQKIMEEKEETAQTIFNKKARGTWQRTYDQRCKLGDTTKICQCLVSMEHIIKGTKYP